MAVGGDAVVLLARFMHGVHMHHGLAEVGELVQGSYGEVHRPMSVAVMPTVLVVMFVPKLISSKVPHHNA